jgi:AraC-like DNA-binding protein/streptogramin lyase
LNNYVSLLYQGKTGGLWAITSSGLNRLTYRDDTIRIHAFPGVKALAGHIILSMFEDPKGDLWFGTLNRGLMCLKENTCYTYTTRDGLPGNTVTCILQDREGTLWFGTENGGLSRFKNGTVTTFSKKDGLSSNWVTALYEDKHGTLWIGTQNGGLNCRKKNSFSAWTSRQGLSHDYVTAIFEDREGNLWIGTYGGGLNRLKDRKITTYFSNKGLSDNVIFPIFQDSKGAIWFGTFHGGINRYFNGTLSTFTREHGLSGNMVWAICEDREGNLWFGTYSGLNCLKNGHFITYTQKDGLSDNMVKSLCADRKGSLWIGTQNGGLNCFEDGTFKTYSIGTGLPANYVTSIIEDSRGNLWIGCFGAGLVRYQYGRPGDDTFTTYTTKEGLSSNYVLSLYEDRENILWIGTMGGGLNRFENETFIAFTTHEGLFNNVVFRIIEDGNNNLWMSCNRGIFRVNKQECSDFIQGKIPGITAVNLDRSDGMVISECNGGFQPAGCKTRDGRIWFPTMKGVAVIDPDAIKINTVPPPIKIEGVKVDDVFIDPKGKDNIELSPGKRRLEFRYTALSFVSPRKIKFRYKLEGFEKEWVDAGASTERIATYTNLSPGRYRFRVTACNNDGTWNQAGASLSFTLEPFFYQTYWFYGLCVVCVILTGVVIHRLHVRRILSKERRKYEKVRLPAEEAEKYLKKLLHFMETEKPYLDPAISARRLAESLMIPHHYLSQVINAKLKQNFYDFINYHRVEEARRILTDSKQNHLTIHEIALKVGFNSKSVFNRAFLKHAHMTPSDFKRKQNNR